MTIAAGGPVVSGQRYTISDVAGHTPGVSVTLSLCDRDSQGPVAPVPVTGLIGGSVLTGCGLTDRTRRSRCRVMTTGRAERAASPMSCNAFRPSSPRSTVTWCSGFWATRIGGSRSRTASPACDRVGDVSPVNGRSMAWSG